MFVQKRPFNEWQIPQYNYQASQGHAKNVFITLDTEYHTGSRDKIKMGNQMITVNQRHPEDCDSIQLAFNYENRSPVLYFVHRDHDETPFVFNDVMKLLKDYLKSIGVYPAIKKQIRTFTLELWTFWGGVDLSVFNDYEKILTEYKKPKNLTTSKLVTIHGNTVFTGKPLKLIVKDKYRHKVNLFKNQRLVIRDMTKLAPGKFSLAKVGDLIKVPKIDTEKWDTQDGYYKGYYKSHMSELWKNRRNDFINYALEDVVVTAQYGSFILKFQKQLTDEGFGDFKPYTLKPSLGSIVGSIIGCRNEQPSQWIINEVYSMLKKLDYNQRDWENILRGICKFEMSKNQQGTIYPEYYFEALFRDLSKHNIKSWLRKHLDFDKIRKGYYFPRYDRRIKVHHKHLVHDMTSKIDMPLNKSFDDAVAAYNGGYNVAQVSGLIPAYGEKRDWDINAAYSEAGHLIPDIAPGLGAAIKNLTNISEADFKDKVVKVANGINGPYTVAVGNFDITYPDNYRGFVITPKNVNEGPRYFKKITNVELSYTDAYTAFMCGAKVFTHSISFVQQDHIKAGTLQGVCQEGHIQDIFQQRRAKCIKHSPEDIMNKNVVNQCYGVTAEGTKRHRSRDYNNGQSYYIPFSRITNPLKSMQYTAITRLHIIYLQKAIWQVDPHVIFLNNVTDGCLTWSGKSLSADDISDKINQSANKWYRAMVHKFFAGRYIKKKDGTGAQVANIRTRMSFSIDNKLKAMVGLSNITPCEVFKSYLDNCIPKISQANHRITGIVEMRHEKKFQHLQSSWNETTDLYFSYDMAQWPVKFVKNGQYVYWVTRPYKDENEFDNLWQYGRDLMKYGVWYSAEYALYFAKTLTECEQGYKFTHMWKAEEKESDGTYPHEGVEVYRNWAFYVYRNKLNAEQSYNRLQQLFVQNGWAYLRGKKERPLPKKSSFKSSVKRLKNRKYNVLPNYVLLHEVGLI